MKGKEGGRGQPGPGCLFLRSLATGWLLLSGLPKYLVYGYHFPGGLQRCCHQFWVVSPLQCLWGLWSRSTQSRTLGRCCWEWGGRAGKETEKEPMYSPSHGCTWDSMQRAHSRCWGGARGGDWAERYSEVPRGAAVAPHHPKTGGQGGARGVLLPTCCNPRPSGAGWSPAGPPPRPQPGPLGPARPPIAAAAEARSAVGSARR